MNYRHIYHAGNFADVMKHFILTLLLQKLCEKDKAFFVLDTHAGIGKYDFQEEAPQKTREYESGIARLLTTDSVSPHFTPYLDIIHKMNTLCTPSVTHSGEMTARSEHHSDTADTHQSSTTGCVLRYYPGSPLITRAFLRPQDKMALCELHPTDYETLKQCFTGDKQVMVRHEDAYTALKAFLPPKERRGLILIDPPFEKKDEYEQLAKGVKEAYRRFSTGIYALWFPIKNRPPIDSFYEILSYMGIPRIMTAEFLINSPDSPDRLNGCGMVFINPPWQLDVTLRETLPLLLGYLGKEQEGNVEIRWLVPE